MKLKALLIAAIAAVTLALCITTASASHLSTSNQNLRVAWTSLEVSNSLVSVTCPLTLEGSFHSATIAKMLGSLIGVITRASINGTNCRGGHMTALTETLPWHVTYEGFNGTLPNITAIRLLLIGLALLIEMIGGLCLMRTSSIEPMGLTAAREANGNLTELTPNEEQAIRLTNVSGCPASTIRFGMSPGDGRISALGSTTQIRLTLI